MVVLLQPFMLPLLAHMGCLTYVGSKGMAVLSWSLPYDTIGSPFAVLTSVLGYPLPPHHPMETEDNSFG